MNDRPEPQPPAPTRAFLDANVLIAAALGGGSRQLWAVSAVQLVTSEYAAQEAWQNLARKADGPSHCDHLLDLLSGIEVVPSADAEHRPARDWNLSDPGDVPILQAAIESGCQYLVMGDIECFGRFMNGQAHDGLFVVKPGTFLQLHGISKGGRLRPD